MRWNDGLRSMAVLLVLVVGSLLVGCAEPEPEEPPPPPPPTPEEIAAKIIGDLNLKGPLPNRGSVFPAAASTKFLSTLRSTNTQQSATQDGKTAMAIVSRTLDQRLRQLEANELWEHVVAYIDGHVIMNPDSHRHDILRDRAESELRKPKVTVTGFYVDGRTDQTAVFLSYYLPLEKVTKNEQVRVGEELYGLKLLGIIGNNQGVQMEYLETGDEFDVLTSSARQ